MTFLKPWRYLLLPLLAVAAVAAFSACGDDDSGATKTPSAAADEAAPADQQKVVMHSVEPQYFDPQRSNFEQDIAIERMLFRGLYQLEATADGGVKAVPAMAAADPTVSADGLTFTVKLKAGLKWSDGQVLTAQHFVDGVTRGCDATVASPYAYLLQSEDQGGILGLKGCDEAQAAKTPAEQTAANAALGIKATDATTVTVTTLTPKLALTFVQIFSLWVTFPARLDLITKFADKWTDPGNIAVNGPYTLTAFTPKDNVVLKPNPNWALSPKPKLQQLTIKFIDDTETAFRQYQTGELDQARIPEPEVVTAKADPKLSKELLVVGSARITAIEMQMNNEVLSKFNVRLALSRAIDRDTLVKVVYDDVNLAAEYWMVKGLPGFQGRDKFKSVIGFDATAAKKALADAGYPNGQGFPTLRFTIIDCVTCKAMAEFLQKNWKDILGININIEIVDSKTRSQRFNTKNFDLFPGGWQLDYPDPENPLVGLFNTGGGNNKYECSDPAIDKAMADAAKATTVDAHIKAYQAVEDLVVTKLCGIAPIFQGALPYLVNPKLGGVKANGTIDAGQPGNWCAECWFVKKQ